MIPKRIFFYWHDVKLPDCLDRFVRTWKNHNPNFEFVTLNQDNLNDYISSYPENFKKLQIQHQSDYIRLKVLYEYGGVYADISTICLKSLEQYIDFKLDRLNGRKYLFSQGVIENFFLASNKHNPELKIWLEELMYAINIGFASYKKIFRRQYPLVLFNLPYMTPYACFYRKLRHHPKVNFLFHEYNFKYLFDYYVNKLFKNEINLSKIQFIKLFGSSRSYFLENIEMHRESNSEIFNYYSIEGYKYDLIHHEKYEDERRKLLFS